METQVSEHTGDPRKNHCVLKRLANAGRLATIGGGTGCRVASDALRIRKERGMENTLEQITNRPLSIDGPMTRLFRAAGVHDFVGAARHILKLPYGRIVDRNTFWLVLEEGRGTCTTKHALLAELAREQDIDVQLMLAIYEMSERNTPGVGRVLTTYGLTYIPEAHCYLRYMGGRLDVTGVPSGAEPIGRFLHEEPISIDQIGAYKNDLHQRFLRDWIVRTEAVKGMSLEKVWCIRGECIAALGAGDYAKP